MTQAHRHLPVAAARTGPPARMPTPGPAEPSPARPARCQLPDIRPPARRRGPALKPRPGPATIFVEWCITVERGNQPDGRPARAAGDGGPAGGGRPPRRVPGLHHPGAAALHPGAGVRAAQPPPAPGPAGRRPGPGPGPVAGGRRGRPLLQRGPVAAGGVLPLGGRPGLPGADARLAGRRRLRATSRPCWPSTSGGGSGAGTSGSWTGTSASGPPRTRPSGAPPASCWC